MSKASGFIVIHRKILDWEWYSEPNTLALFIHLLLTANYTDGRFKGMEVKRGQLVTSLKHLSTKSGLSIQQTRTALEHLQSTKEITNQSYPQYRVITIVKYDDYQLPTNLPTNDQQTTNKPSNKPSTKEVTNEQQQYNNNNKYNKETNITKEQSIESGKTAKRFIPPSLEEVSDYIEEIGANIDPAYFIDYYETRGWKLKTGQIKDWKACVRTWMRKEGMNNNTAPSPIQRKVLPAQDFEQRDYSDVPRRMMEEQNKRFVEHYQKIGVWDYEKNCADPEKLKEYEAKEEERKRIKAEADEAARKVAKEAEELKRKEAEENARAFKVCTNCIEARDCAKKRFYENTTGCTSFRSYFTK